jgi:hypothetical protein
LQPFLPWEIIDEVLYLAGDPSLAFSLTGVKKRAISSSKKTKIYWCSFNEDSVFAWILPEF